MIKTFVMIKGIGTGLLSEFGEKTLVINLVLEKILHADWFLQFFYTVYPITNAKIF